MNTALCPSCDTKKRSAAVNPDGLCDECRGDVRPCSPSSRRVELVKRYDYGNPFAAEAADARIKYEKLYKAANTRDAAMSRSFPLGVGFDGSKAAERRLERTIKRAKELNAARKEAERLECSATLFDQGRINAQGRSITADTAKRREKRDSSAQKRSERKAAALKAREGKEPWEVTPEMHADSAGYFAGSARELVMRDHCEAIMDAIASGKSVPEEVRKAVCYPGSALAASLRLKGERNVE